MSTIHTDLGTTRESARRLRVEPSGSITQTNVQKALEQISAAPTSVIATTVTAAQSPYTPTNADLFLFVDTSGGAVQILLQTAAARSNIPLVVKDVTGNASTNNITLTPSGAETIDGLASLPINADFGGYQIAPRTAAWTVMP